MIRLVAIILLSFILTSRCSWAFAMDTVGEVTGLTGVANIERVRVRRCPVDANPAPRPADLGLFFRQRNLSLDLQAGYGNTHGYATIAISHHFDWDHL